MATTTLSVSNGNRGKIYTLTYSVSSTSTATTVTLTSLKVGNSSWAGANIVIRFYADSTSTQITSITDNGWASDSTHAINKTYSWNKAESAQTKHVLVYGKQSANGSESTIGTANIEVSVPALAKYAVTYNANGGSGAPATQYKVHGKNLTLSTVKPTRSGFSFVKWFTAADGTGTGYDPGATYGTDAALNLYAKWSAIPSVTSLKVIRSDENGDQDDSGTYAAVTATWTMDSSTSESATVTGTITPQGGTSSAITLSGTTTGTGGTVTALVPNMDPDTQYVVAITAANGSNTATRSAVLTRAFFIMDFKAGGGGIGIGRAAPSDSLAVGYNAEFDGNVDIFGPTNIDSTLDTTGKVTTSNVIQAKGGMVVGPSTTSNVVTYDSTNPKIEFQNANASQNGQLIFTDYDAVHSGATLAWITDQAQSWFHTQHIHATGNVYSNSNHFIRDTTADTSSATNGVSSDTYKNYSVLDKNSRYASYLETTFKTDGTVNVGLTARNFGTGANVNNGISLSVTNDGGLGVSVTTPYGWRNALGASSGTWPQSIGGTGRAQSTANRTYWCGRILYDNNTGTSGTVTLAETAANFAFMFIGIRSDASQYTGLFVRSPNGKKVDLACVEAASNYNYIKTRLVTISGTSISGTTSTHTGLSGSAAATSSANEVYITHVIGFS